MMASVSNMAACCTTFLPLLTLILSVSVSQSADSKQCAVLVENPLSLFGHSKTQTEPVTEYLASDLEDCIDICCHDKKDCNVGLFIDSTSSDTNCWLYSCYPLDSCTFKIRKAAQVFVDPHATYKYNYDYLTTAYQDYNVDGSSNYQSTDYITEQDNNEEYYIEEDSRYIFSTSQSNLTYTSLALTTTEMPSGGTLESGLEPTSAVNDASLSPVNNSVLQGDTYATPNHGDVVKNDTFLTEQFKMFGENDSSTTYASEETDENNSIVPSFTPENDTAHENGNLTAVVKDEYDTAKPADQLVNIVSFSYSLQSEVKSSEIPAIADQEYYNIQPTRTFSNEDLAVLPPTDTSYGNFLMELPIFSISDWSLIGASTLAEVESARYRLELDGADSTVILKSVMTVGASYTVVSASRGMTGEAVTRWTASRNTSSEPEQTTTMTLDISPPSDNPYQNSYNDTMSRADIDYQPSEAVVGLLVSALAVGCVCALAVVGVLSLRLYDGYKRRHYSRLDHLINGIYN